MDSLPIYSVPSWDKTDAAFQPGDLVHVTEKLHGQFCVVGYDNQRGRFAYAKQSSSRKARALLNALTQSWPDYLRAASDVVDAVEMAAIGEGRSLAFYGEIIGPGVRNVRYMLDDPAFFVFDVLVGGTSHGMWLSPHDTYEMAEAAGIPHVPVLSEACRLDHGSIVDLAGQPSALGGGPREGVVVRCASTEPDKNARRRIVQYKNPHL